MLAKFRYLEEDTKYWIVSAVVCLTILTFVATSSEDFKQKGSLNYDILKSQSVNNDYFVDNLYSDTLAEMNAAVQFDLADFDPDKLTKLNNQY